MTLQTIAGPFNRQDAEDTAHALGNKNHSVYGIERKDADGYGTDVYDYYVERDNSITPNKIFGYNIDQLIAKQYK